MKYLIFHITLLFVFAASPALGFTAQETDTITVYVTGTHDDSRFEPAIVEVSPESVIQFVVKEGMHTVTAYHPDNRRPLGIPENAESFDSGMLEVGDIWYLTVTTEGEYNYFCMPHEQFGHKGQIIVNPNETSTKLTEQTKSVEFFTDNKPILNLN